jgi:hypothetical protein
MLRTSTNVSISLLVFSCICWLVLMFLVYHPPGYFKLLKEKMFVMSLFSIQIWHKLYSFIFV